MIPHVGRTLLSAAVDVDLDSAVSAAHVGRAFLLAALPDPTNPSTHRERAALQRRVRTRKDQASAPQKIKFQIVIPKRSEESALALCLDGITPHVGRILLSAAVDVDLGSAVAVDRVGRAFLLAALPAPTKPPNPSRKSGASAQRQDKKGSG